jgi:hypothetical protein
VNLQNSIIANKTTPVDLIRTHTPARVLYNRAIANCQKSYRSRATISFQPSAALVLKEVVGAVIPFRDV